MSNFATCEEYNGSFTSSGSKSRRHSGRSQHKGFGTEILLAPRGSGTPIRLAQTVAGLPTRIRVTRFGAALRMRAATPAGGPIFAHANPCGTDNIEVCKRGFETVVS
jgi:hypothetical protein